MYQVIHLIGYIVAYVVAHVIISYLRRNRLL